MPYIQANLDSLSKGIRIDGYGVLIPWLISESQLFELFPSSTFTISAGGCWPMLRLKFLGFSALWGFNFVSHPLKALSELQFRNESLHSPKRSYLRSAARLRKALGPPNCVECVELGQHAWRFGQIVIDNSLVNRRGLRPSRGQPEHVLSVRVIPPAHQQMLDSGSATRATSLRSIR